MFSRLPVSGVVLQLRMAGDSRVLMDHNMEIGVTPAQVNQTDMQISHLCKRKKTMTNKRARKKEGARWGGHKRTERISRADRSEEEQAVLESIDG